MDWGGGLWGGKKGDREKGGFLTKKTNEKKPVPVSVEKHINGRTLKLNHSSPKNKTDSNRETAILCVVDAAATYTKGF